MSKCHGKIIPQSESIKPFRTITFNSDLGRDQAVENKQSDLQSSQHTYVNPLR